ncbi:MAG: hypothetical protein IKB83_02305 [Mycoplasmataceae bacterium]|nr:hypothetical protein [Mycoplasmataceae bacterium]
MKKTKFWIPLVATTSLSIFSPIIASSCSEAPVGQINKEQQVEMLNSEAAKITLLDSWLTSTFSSLYAENIKSSNSLSEQKLVENTIRYYFDYLSWPTTNSGKLVGSDETINFADDSLFSQTEKQTFVSLVQEAYLFYINFMSTIQPQSSDSSTSTTSPSVYFKLKALEWQKNKYKTLITIEDNNNKILTINDFNPSLNYTGMTTSSTNGQTNSIIETDYKILMLTRGTLVYQNVLKLLLSEMYFLKSTEKLVKNGTNFNKLTKNKNTVNYINTMAYVGENNDFSSYLFKKYAIENSPQFTWSYSSTDYDTKTSSASIISTIQGFNNLKTTKEESLSTILAPNSTETSVNSLTKLQAFSSLSLVTNSEETLEGDLSINLDTIKSYGSSKIGLLDKDTNKLFTFSNLEAIKQARQYNSSSSNNIKLMIPSINIKNTSLEKYSNNILVEDIEVLWSGQPSNVSIENNKTVFKNGNQQIVINSISYNPSKETKEITISFTYSFTISGTINKNTNNYSLDYEFKISNWGESDSDQINQFANSYIFEGQADQVGIKIFNNDSTPTGITYYLRILPLFTKSDSILIGDKWYMRGKFGFENTPWKNEADQRKLVYFLMLSDSNLYSKIQDFYLFNNYNVTGNTSELSQQISNLGLNAKTNADRRKEGII